MDYIGHFSAGIEEQGWTVRVFSWRQMFTMRPPAVLHIHWPENIVRSTSRIRELGKLVLLTLYLLLVRLFGTQVVFTGHNLKPHEGGRCSEIALRVYRRLSSGAIHLSQTGLQSISTAMRGRHPSKFICLQLGDLTEGISVPSRSLARARFCLESSSVVTVSPGRPRTHKNHDRIVECFCNGRDADWQLLLQGYGPSGCAGLISLPQTIADEELIAVLASADLAVFDFTEVLHSASVALALGVGTPTLAPRIGAIADLSLEFPSERLRLYDGPLTVEVLSGGVAWSREVSLTPISRPLTALSWSELSRRTTEFYSSLVLSAV